MVAAKWLSVVKQVLARRRGQPVLDDEPVAGELPKAIARTPAEFEAKRYEAHESQTIAA